MKTYAEKIYANPVETYLSSLGSAYSVKTSERAIKKMCELLSGNNCYFAFDWGDLDYSKISKLKVNLNELGLAASSINTYIAILKSVAKEVWRQRLISTRDYFHIQQITRLRSERVLSGRSLSPDEIEFYISRCIKGGSVLDLRNAAIFSLAYGAGLRSHELSEVDLDNYQGDFIRIIGKGNKERINPVPKQTQALLKRWIAKRGIHEGALFLRITSGGNVTNKRLSRRGFWCIFNYMVKKYSGPRFTPHDLRRSFATNLLEADIDVFTVQSLMGHTNCDTTKRYDMRDLKTKADAVKLLRFS